MYSFVSQVAVVGGGIAGAWVAYRLVQRGVRTALITADDLLPAVSRRFSTGLVLAELVDDSRFAEEFAELAGIVPYRAFGEFLRPGERAGEPKPGAGDGVVAAVLARYEELGGVRLKGRVTDLVVEDGTCVGLRYEWDGVPGRILCNDVVLAAGGFCGLFADGVGTHSGHLLGTYARHGGLLANLEQFARVALGDLDRKVPCQPADFAVPVRLLRAGEPAVELAQTLEYSHGPGRDLDVFERYWTKNLDVPHTAVSSFGVFRLGPVRGFAMGGVAIGSTLANVHATGECADGLVTHPIAGKPFVSFLARGRELADLLAERPAAVEADFPHGQVRLGPDGMLRKEIEYRLDTFRDNTFAEPAAARFALWCQEERRLRQDSGSGDLEDVDLLILAEAYTRSILARTESRGFFVRPDFPVRDPLLDGCHTLARYDAEEDRVLVSVRP